MRKMEMPRQLKIMQVMRKSFRPREGVCCSQGTKKTKWPKVTKALRDLKIKKGVHGEPAFSGKAGRSMPLKSGRQFSSGKGVGVIELYLLPKIEFYPFCSGSQWHGGRIGGVVPLERIELSTSPLPRVCSATEPQRPIKEPCLNFPETRQRPSDKRFSG